MSKEFAVSLCILNTSPVSKHIFPATISNDEPVGMGKFFPMKTSSPDAVIICASAVIEPEVKLARVQPITTVVTEPGTVYTSMFVFAAVELPSLVFSLNVLATFFILYLLFSFIFIIVFLKTTILTQ